MEYDIFPRIMTTQSDLDMTSVVLQNILLNLDSEHIQRRQLSLEQSDFIFRL